MRLRESKAAIWIAALALVALLPMFAGSVAAQNEKGKKKAEAQDASASPVPVSDTQTIDLVISQMLGAWQVGDVDAMHKAYADDLTSISGTWDPPIFGWQNFARAYQAQHARIQNGRLDRTNTFTKLMGDTAWVTYQWRFTGDVDNRAASGVGHTTLLLQKRAGSWVIILNHTSAVPESGQPSGVAAAPHDASATAPAR